MNETNVSVSYKAIIYCALVYIILDLSFLYPHVDYFAGNLFGYIIPFVP